MNIRRVASLAVSVVLAIALPVGLGAAKCGTLPAPKHAAPKKVKPAPNPDPAPSRRGIGNVELVFTVGTNSSRVVTSWNVGRGWQHGATKHKGETSWTETAKPGQHVTFIAAHSKPGDKAWIDIEVYQRNNGRILCRDNNNDDPSGGAQCSGVVVV